MSQPEPPQARDAASIRRKERREGDGDGDGDRDKSRDSTRARTSTTLTSLGSALVATTTSVLSSPIRSFLPAPISTFSEITTKSTTPSPSSSTPTSISAISEITTKSVTPSPSSSTSTTLPTSISAFSEITIKSTVTPSPPSATTGVAPSPSKTTTIVLNVVAASAGAAVLFLVLFCIYKSLFRHRKSSPDTSTPPMANNLGTTAPSAFTPYPRERAQDTTSRLWGSSNGGSVTGDISPPAPPMAYNTANNAVDRQERLGLVRNDLLRPQERGGALMRSYSQAKRW